MEKKLIIGLGNPGNEYAKTRHNLGARVVQAWVEKVGKEGLVELGVSCLLPTTFMNETGQAAAAYLKNNPVKAAAILLVHDDLELPFGEIKLISDGSAKGHNGVKSIQTTLGTLDIPRLRLGVGRPPEGLDPRDYVLGKFSLVEEEAIAGILPRVFEEISRFVQSN